MAGGQNQNNSPSVETVTPPVLRHSFQDRWIAVFCLLFIVGMLAIGWHLQRTQDDLIQTTAVRNAAQYTKTLEAFRSLYTTEVVGPAKKAGLQVTHNYRDLENAIPLPATLSMALGNEMDRLGGAQTKLYSPYPFPWREKTGGLTDEFAEDAWKNFSTAPETPFYRFEEKEGRQVLRYAVADRLRASCVGCHNSHPETPKNDWQVGEVRGVLEVTYPLSAAIAQASSDFKGTITLLVGLAVLAIGAFIVVIMRFRKHGQTVKRSNISLEIVNRKLQLQSLEADAAEQSAIEACEEANSANIELVKNASELVDARLAALNMMQDINTTKIQAEDANRAKSEFLANMSHEIRTPMTAILGFAENLLDDELNEDEKTNCVHTIRRNGEYLIGLINDILDLSKVEAGKMTVENKDCRPCHIIAEVSALMCVRATAKGLPFHTEYVGAIPEIIQCDPTRLRQILINLVGNAMKFTEVGAVRLVTRYVVCGVTPCLQFDVMDTGRGMSDEQVAKLFQPFVQADSSTTRKYGGTGLGLTISKRFAELLGGDITIPATELGVGTTFRVTIATGSLDGVTMLQDPTSMTIVADAEPSDAEVAQHDLNGLRILLAEDGPDNQRLISFVLKKAGADVTVMENGKLAMDAALFAREEGKSFDVILMDMQMPVMDGYEASGNLRNKGYTWPIIALTAHAMGSDRQRCINAGCDDYVTKPVDRKKLIGLIQEYTRKSHSMPESVQVDTPVQLLLQGCRILLAEDNPANQVLINGVLKKAGGEITIVKDGKLAFDAVLSAINSDNPFDIILTDIQMPIMGGDELTKLLRDKEYTKPIIALTANASVGDQEKYLDMGFNDYTTKPINRLQLIEIIHAQWVGAEVDSCGA